MREQIKLKTLNEAVRKIPFGKRPKNVFAEDKNLFEQSKNPAQIELIETAARLVSNHLKRLGIENISFDEKRIIFTKQTYKPQGGYYPNQDFIIIPELSEANLAMFIHEIIHAQSAEWRNYNEDNLNNPLTKKQGGIKSGFDRGSFRILNEGVTEKITRSIMIEDATEVIRLKQLFVGKMEIAVAEQEREFKEEILPNCIKEGKEEDAQKANQELIKIIKRNYSFLMGNISRNSNVELINNFIEGIAKYNIKNKTTILDFEQEKIRVWNEFQEAYFKGNTMYLRNIDKVFGKGFLKRIEELPFLKNEEEVEISFALLLKEQKDMIQRM